MFFFKLLSFDVKILLRAIKATANGQQFPNFQKIKGAKWLSYPLLSNSTLNLQGGVEQNIFNWCTFPSCALIYWKFKVLEAFARYLFWFCFSWSVSLFHWLTVRKTNFCKTFICFSWYIQIWIFVSYFSFGKLQKYSIEESF